MSLKKFKIKIFSDGADFKSIVDLNNNQLVKGFTTNPTLMKKAGIKNYKKFALKVLSKIKKKHVSFEVFSDDFKIMKKQAKEISSWQNNTFAKIPITNSKGVSSLSLIKELHNSGIKLNVTAVFTIEQVKKILKIVNKKTEICISIFAGRIADTGIDPLSTIKKAIKLRKNKKNVKFIWASTREILNVYQADKSGCDIITVPSDFIKKLNLYKKNLTKYSIETSKTFFLDGQKSKFKL